MKIRRILATAVAAAVTTPVVLLSAAPAFADTKPSAPSQTQEQQPTIEQLQKKVAEAQKAYDDAVAAYDELQKALDALDKPEHLLQVALADAKKAAEKADAAKTAADEAVVDAQAELDAAVTDEEKAAAQTALDEAKTKAATAATDKTTADGNVTKANKAIEDARFELLKKTHAADTAKKDALKTLDAAKKALADAEPPHADCKDVSDRLTVDLSGPAKISAGTSATFTVKLTNDTGHRLDQVYAETEVAVDEGDLYGHVDVEWGYPNSEWDEPSQGGGFTEIGLVKPGQEITALVRITIDEKAPAAESGLLIHTGYDNVDGSCGYVQTAAYSEFDVVAKAKDEEKPSTGSTGGSTAGGNTGTTQQGGTSTTSVTSTGQLAKTGANDVMPQFALAGAAAVALGAGAMFVVRRRKADADA
ncbi:LPXTG cell wall anchor domain-containing protein [Streptomyces sp. NPDC057430]|uniref:LPXTG cell wall anchor domain-containing protein n=1 Tax=unclassified Streptomyces TaxID=2593676 RepID=UPI0036C01A75